MVCYIEVGDNRYTIDNDDSNLVFVIGFMNFICGCVICVIAYTMYSGILMHLIVYALNERSGISNMNKSIL
jgi:hypothetical protein